MMSTILRKAIIIVEFFNAWVIIQLNKLIPKHKANNRILIFANIGIGDLVMFMPVIREIYNLEYDVTFSVVRQPQKAILQKHFPKTGYDIKGIYGRCLINFHEVYKRKNILKIIRLRIPIRIGHSYWKWKKFFNHPVPFDKKASKHEVYKNLELLEWFSLEGIPYPTYLFKSINTFFEAEEVTGLPEKYICIAPFCHTDRRKEYDFTDIIRSSDKTVVLIGSREELYDCRRLAIRCNFGGNRPVIVKSGMLNIFQTAHIIKNSDHFYSHEGGLAHIAIAVGARCTIYHTCCTEPHVIYSEKENVEYIYFESEKSKLDKH